MVVNDNACGLDKRGAREVIAGKPAPTECVSFGVGMTWRVVWQKALYNCDLVVIVPLMVMISS